MAIADSSQRKLCDGRGRSGRAREFVGPRHASPQTEQTLFDGERRISAQDGARPRRPGKGHGALCSTLPGASPRPIAEAPAPFARYLRKAGMRKTFLVCYAICDDRRLPKGHKTM